jgi:hypothetical protein
MCPKPPAMQKFLLPDKLRLSGQPMVADGLTWAIPPPATATFREE